MSRYLDTRGHSILSVGICARCSIKFPRDELRPDPNSPGLYVCRQDLDQLDPYRLPARQADQINIQDPRPDVSLSSPGYETIYVNPIQAVMGTDGGVAVGTQDGQALAIAPPVTQINQRVVAWSARTSYPLGSQVTPMNPVGLNAAGQQIFVFLCIVPGLSGVVAPTWPEDDGITVLDGQVIWLNVGLYLP